MAFAPSCRRTRQPPSSKLCWKAVFHLNRQMPLAPFAALPVLAWLPHQGCDAVDRLQRREVQFVYLVPAEGLARADHCRRLACHHGCEIAFDFYVVLTQTVPKVLRAGIKRFCLNLSVCLPSNFPCQRQKFGYPMRLITSLTASNFSEFIICP